jgi:CBS-domain-containing membrane protein
MFVQDVMTTDPVMVRTGTSVKQALVLLDRHGVTSMPVVGSGRRIRGVVSEADLIRESLARDTRVQETPLEGRAATPPRTVDEVFTPHAVVVHPDDDLATAVELMTSTSVKSLPVVDRKDRVVGIVSRSDVVRLLARADSTIEGEVDQLLRSLGYPNWLVEVHDGVVAVTGPVGQDEGALARTVAGTVPGVVDVRID